MKTLLLKVARTFFQALLGVGIFTVMSKQGYIDALIEVVLVTATCFVQNLIELINKKLGDKDGS